MTVRAVVLEAFVRDLFEEPGEISPERVRIMLARNGLDVVALDGPALSAPLIAKDPAADDARLEIRRDELRREGATSFMNRIVDLVVEARVGSGPLERAILVDDITNEMDELLEGLDLKTETLEDTIDQVTKGGNRAKANR